MAILSLSGLGWDQLLFNPNCLRWMLAIASAQKFAHAMRVVAMFSREAAADFVDFRNRIV